MSYEHQDEGGFVIPELRLTKQNLHDMLELITGIPFTEEQVMDADFGQPSSQNKRMRYWAPETVDRVAEELIESAFMSDDEFLRSCGIKP